MRIPDNLMPKVAADRIGVSLGKLAVLLGVSYHTLVGWGRRGSAPRTTVEWLASAYKDAEKKRLAELATLPPVEIAKAIMQPIRFPQPIPPRKTLRPIRKD